MCNGARLRSNPETLFEWFGASWAADAYRLIGQLVERHPTCGTYIMREERDARLLVLAP